MILSDIDIRNALRESRIKIEPQPDEAQFNSSSLDLRLDEEFKEYNEDLLQRPGINVEIEFSKISIKNLTPYLRDLPKRPDGSVVIKPNSFVLAQTLERITLPIESQIAARVEGRSTTARLGLVVHLSAPTIHAGFTGKITLEIINQGKFPIILHPKHDKICQLIFEMINTKPSKENLSEFQGQTTVTGSTR